MICGVQCSERESCLEYQKRLFGDDYVIVNKTTTQEEIQTYCSEGKNIIWDNFNLYPEIREVRLSLIPDNYHKTAVYVKPTEEELKDSDLFMKMMQFVAPSEFENFECIIRYISNKL